ncbi:hypothetical protein PPERSA_03734 [Pseudocohnilembus persalinus]|uniref:RAP domain-containing protein n=1 Tax=Pseudocohnilembus persalinus TaxID=266149 RepID=A0A0V0QHJ5_PSEPJ|nr:hypothetical protein PPERSA_03734 [Pseudocohnilembus persalinus]|eukprot:KRX01650.1 hypothetical protein PPERSA_03734 [Pseudocohnilembus persalinus]
MLAFKQIVKQSLCQKTNSHLLINNFKKQNTLINSQLKYNFAKTSKHPFKVKITEDLINVKDVEYPFNKEEKDVISPKKPAFFAQTFKKRQLEAKQKKEFILYQQDLRNQQQQDKKQVQTKETVEKEFLWDQGVPQSRPYDNVQNKELTYIYRDSKYFERSNKMISHLTAFQTPQQIHDQEIRNLIDEIKKIATPETINNSSVDFIVEEFYQQNKEITNKLVDLKNLVQKTNYKLLPAIGLALSYELRYKIDFAGIWTEYVKILEKNIHHYTLLEMAQIRYALAGNFPKIGTPTLHKAIQDIIQNELHLCTVTDLLHIMHAFRNLKNNKIYKKIVNEIINRKSEIKTPNQLAEIIYTYASCRIKTANRNKFRLENEELIEAQKLIEFFLENLNASILKMDPPALVKLATAFAVLRLPAHYQDILRRIEKAAISKKNEFDSVYLAQLFYAFSKIQNGQGYGSPQFFEEFQPLVKKFFNKDFTNNEKAKILYAYTFRKQIDEKQFNAQYLPWIKQEMPNFTYTDLHYISQAMIVYNVTDKNIWKAFVHNIANQPYVCPITHYLPLKQARYYIDSLFPQWNMEPYDQACQNAEFSFSSERLKKNALNQELVDFGQILKTKLNIDIKLFVEFDNMLLVDFAVLPERVAILYQDTYNSQYDDLSVSSIKYDIKAKILEANKWGVLKISKHELQEQGLNRYTWLEEKFKEAYQKQQQVYKDEELERWGASIYKMEKMGENATLETERHRQSGITIDF